MNQPQEEITIVHSPDYSESYANAVHIRVTVWDFLLTFGTIKQTVPGKGEISHFQGIILSPQQAKAVVGLLTTEVQNYEKAMGEIRYEAPTPGKVIQ